MDSSHFSRLRALMYLFGLFMVWHHGVLVEAGINSTYLDIGQNITRIASNNFKDIYIGGVNFIAQLSPNLGVKFNLTIGPVTTPEHCAPQPAPCDNQVRVLEVDPGHEMLLVCGSAYRGTCTLHNLQDIREWFCLYGDTNKDGADVVSGSHERSSVVHFFSSTTANSRLVPVSDQMFEPRSCRSSGFGHKSVYSNDASPKYNKVQQHPPLVNYDRSVYFTTALNERGTREHANVLQDQEDNLIKRSTYSYNDEQRIQSKVIIAGSAYTPQWSMNPLHLSIRHINFDGSQYTMGYSRDQQSTPVGFQMNNGNDISMTPDYKLSFTWDNYSYFLFLQQTTDCERPGPCVVTKISRTCHDPSSILPYVEIPLACEEQKKKFRLLKSATLGTVGLVHSASYATVPVLLMTFGNSSQPASSTVDPMYGTALCAVTLDDLNKVEFNFILDICADANFNDTVKQASWISGLNQYCSKEPRQNGQCRANTKNKYVQGSMTRDMTAMAYIKDISVVNVLSQTHIVGVDDQGRSSLHEKMDVFLLTSLGSLKKLSLSAFLRGRAFGVQRESSVVDFFNLSETVASNSVGITDHARAVMYVTSGTKVIEFDLELCLQLQTCAECRVRDRECLWCPAENKCRDRKIASTVCSRTIDSRCPPILNSFAPAKVPTLGGTRLTINGAHLGVHGEGQVNVTVCDQPCDNIFANESRITCTVRQRCPSCADKCDIAINVNHRMSEGNTSSSQMLNRQWVEYVTPTVTSFSPTFGPARGGTVVWFQGQNLQIGSSTKITVDDSVCDVLQDSALSCRIREDSNRSPKLGVIRISIDDFNIMLSNKQFRFRPNPTVKNITPLITIASGGVTIVVDGTNIDSVAVSMLMLKETKIPVGSDPNCTLVLSQKCHPPISNKKMICKTPDVSRCFRTNVAVQVIIDMDGTDMLGQSPKLQNMAVSADPRFREVSVSVHSKSLIIRGENIPDWIDRSDITVTFENTTLKVTELKSHHIICELRSTNFNELETRVSSNQVGYNEEEDPELSSNDTRLSGSAEGNARDDANTSDINANIMSETPIWKSMGTSEKPFNPVTNNSQSVSKRGSNYKLLTSPSTTTKTTTRSVNNNGGNNTVISTVSPRLTTQRWTEKTAEILIKIGNYQQRVEFVIFYPEDNRTGPVTDKASASKLDITLIAGAGGAGVLLLLLVVVSCVMYIRAKRAHALVKEQAFYMSSLSGSQHGSKEGALPSLKQILQSVIEPNQTAEMDKLIISLECLTVGKSIGSGNFGCVFEGFLAVDKETPAEKVAVKTLQDPSAHSIDLREFVKEAVLMRDFQHPHVLGLIGLAEKAPGIPYVILPYMDNGDLLTFVRDASVCLSLHDVIKFGADIASGMAYLSTLKFVHRDLAARNCMLDNLYRVKVADFGLCRDIYEKGYYTSDNRKKLPIRWMAVESIEHGEYSSKSDVWSLGVVLWELLCRGVTPYPGVNGWDVINFLRHRRLAPPFFCPDPLYDLMMQCWAKDPNTRPDFVTVQTQLLQMIGQSPTITDTMKRRRGDTLITYVTDSPTETHTFTKKEDTKPEKIPRKTLQARITKQSNNNPQTLEQNAAKQAKGAKTKEMPYVNVNLPSTTVVNNVLITIPTCYSHRDVSKTAAGTYIQLVDNYEPPPKFSNPILRSMKKHSKKVQDGHSKVSKKGHDSTANSSGYSIPVEYLPTQNSNGGIVNDDLDGRSANSEGSVNNLIGRDSSYYELENASLRLSETSDGRAAWSMLCNNGSHTNIVETGSQNSSTNNSSSSLMSTLSAPNSKLSPAYANRAAGNKLSPLVEPVENLEKRTPKQRAIKPAGGRAKSADVLTYL